MNKPKHLKKINIFLFNLLKNKKGIRGHYYIIALLICVVAFFQHTVEKDVHCKIVKVVDGDTVHCLENHTVHKVRLDGIDAPERGQTFGKKAQQALSERIMHQNVALQLHGEDRYQRKIATILLHDEDINAWLIQEGYAWAYLHYLRSDKKASYIALEKQARQQQRGLWADPNAVRPDIFRRQKRDKREQ